MDLSGPIFYGSLYEGRKGRSVNNGLNNLLASIRIKCLFLRMSQVLLNGSSTVNYTIHGQDLHLEFHFPNAWFVTVYYNEVPAGDTFRKRPLFFAQRYHWFRRHGIFTSRMNGFYPTLRITVWSPWPKRIKVPLSIHHVELSNALPNWVLKPYRRMGEVRFSKVVAPLSIPDVSLVLPHSTSSVPAFPSSSQALQHSLTHFKNNPKTNLF